MTELSGAEQGGASPPNLWDPVVRVSHWGLALVVLGNAVITKGGSVWHIWIGWTGLTLLVLRLLWGLVGPREARFIAFPPNPRAAISHLGELVAGRPRHYASHNPAGAMMVYTLWAALAVVIVTGLVMSGPSPFRATAEQAAFAAGDWSVLVKEDSTDAAANSDAASSKTAREWAKTVHEAAANLILVLASLHVAGVFVESLMMRRNLVQPMLLGLRPKIRANRQKDRE